MRTEHGSHVALPHQTSSIFYVFTKNKDKICYLETSHSLLLLGAVSNISNVSMRLFPATKAITHLIQK